MYTDIRIYGYIIYGYMDTLIYGYMDGYMDIWIYGYMDIIYGYMDAISMRIYGYAYV